MLEDGISDAAIINFTFHSGYIPMGFYPLLFLPRNYFTFHSGYIPIEGR